MARIDYLQIPRFPLPDEWEVTDTQCVIVRIPNNQQYLGQFIGLLDTLKWSRNFARDDTKTGAAIVSRTWQSALESEPITVGCGIILRQNPANVCQLQQSIDGGVTWTLAFDYSLCSQSITVPAPYPGSPTGASDAAAQAIRTIFIGLLTLTPDICLWTREQYIANATEYMRQYDASYANPAALGQIYDAFCGMTEPEKAEAISECGYLKEKADVENCASPDGLFDWLNCLNQTIMDWLNQANTDLMQALMQAAAALSGNGWQNASAGGEGGGAGFGDTCEWIAEFDLTIGDGDWTFIVSCGQPTGQWTGAGLMSIDGHALENCVVLKNRLAAKLPTALEYTFTGMKIWIVPGTPSNGYERYLAYVLGADHTPYTVIDAPFGSTSPIEVTVPPGGVYGIQLNVDHTDGVMGDIAGYSKVQIYGSGSIPPEYVSYIIA